eukprot:53024-Rhodomonas_salina.2
MMVSGEARGRRQPDTQPRRYDEDVSAQCHVGAARSCAASKVWAMGFEVQAIETTAKLRWLNIPSQNPRGNNQERQGRPDGMRVSCRPSACVVRFMLRWKSHSPLEVECSGTESLNDMAAGQVGQVVGDTHKAVGKAVDSTKEVVR